MSAARHVMAIAASFNLRVATHPMLILVPKLAKMLAPSSTTRLLITALTTRTKLLQVVIRWIVVSTTLPPLLRSRPALIVLTRLHPVVVFASVRSLAPRALPLARAFLPLVRTLAAHPR